MFKVIRTFDMKDSVELEQDVLKDVAEIVQIPCLTEDELIEKAGSADAVICAYEPFTKRVIDHLPNLKMIAFKTIGYNFAHIDYAREKGIAVSHITRYCAGEVADYTVAQMLMLNRRIMQFNDSVHKDKKWDLFLFPEMRRFSTLTIGLLGFGNIPRLITERLKPFGPKVIAYDPYVDPQLAKSLGVELMSMEEVLAQSDYVSIHLPLNDETAKLMNKERFAIMKDGAMLINSARGGVIDEEELIKALDSGKLRYYAADVVSAEFADMATHPFSFRDDIILTPHIAFFSQESMREGRIEAVENVLHFFKGEYSKCQIVNGVSGQ